MDEFIIQDETEEKQECAVLATVKTTSGSNGIHVQFDGDSEESEKAYSVNSYVKFSVGDRALMLKIGGSYVAICPVDKTSADHFIPPGGRSGQVLSKLTDASYTTVWKSIGEIPSGGTSGQVLTKNSATDFDVKWAAASGGGSELSNGNYKVSLSAGTLTPTTSTYAVSLGTSTAPFKNLYTSAGAVSLGGTSVKICTAATGQTLGFFGGTGSAKQTLSLTSNNMGYTSVTSSNYLYALNNLIGILKTKYGLIT